MEIRFESKGDFKNLERWLDKANGKGTAEREIGVSSKVGASTTLSLIASEGERSLRRHTPRGATGETANGWTSETTTKGDETEIAWRNKAHPEAGISIAKIIHTGHGTGTGGYVPPKPYINKAMDEVFKGAGDRIAREMIK